MKILALERSGLYYGSAINLEEWIQVYAKVPDNKIDAIIGEDGEIVEKLKLAGASVKVEPIPKIINNYGKKNTNLLYAPITVFLTLIYNVKRIFKTSKNYDFVVFNNYRTAVYYLLFLVYFSLFSRSKIILRLQISQLPVKFIFEIVRFFSDKIIVHGTEGYCEREFGRDLRFNSKVACIPNPVDTKKFNASNSTRIRLREELGISEDTFVIMSVCYIEPRKGVYQLVKTFSESKMKNSILVHIGGHGTHEQYYEKVKSVANKNVILMGKKSELHNLYNIADVFVLNSEYEGMPYVIVEAMSMGLPVVSTYSGSNVEVLSDSAGLLVEYDNNEELLNAIESLYKDEKLRAAMGKRARQRVVSLYGKDSYFKSLKDVFK